MTIRLATWNLERVSPRAWRRAPAQQRRMAEVAADIWVLTETFVTRSPGDGFCGVFSPSHPERHPDPDERWTAIWSRWPIKMVKDPAPHRRGTVTALVSTPVGPLLVYGTVMAYQHEPNHDDGRPARGWEVHTAEVARQVVEWRRLRELFAGVPLVVAGDFNQARSGARWSYGTNAARQAATDGLDQAGLVCLTQVDLAPAGVVSERSHVEHICASAELTPESSVLAWDRVDTEGIRLSDHPTIAIDLRTTLQAEPIEPGPVPPPKHNSARAVSEHRPLPPDT